MLAFQEFAHPNIRALPMSLRIAYLVNQYPMVSHTFIRREILALERQGFDILRISLQGWNAELVDPEDLHERTLTRYVLQGGVVPLLWGIFRTLLKSPLSFIRAFVLAVRMSKGSERALPFHLIYLAEACRILPWINSFGAKHIHAHFGSNSAEIVMLANALGGLPYSFTVHGQDELTFGGIEEKVRRAAFVVAISTFGLSQLYRKLDYSHWTKVQVVHCGLETSFHNFTATPFSTTPRIICVSRLSREKGHLILIEAFRILSNNGLKFELVFAGDGDMRIELEKLIARYGLTGKIRITGWINGSQVRDEILASRGLVLPSFTEGLPVVIMEAMALRRPALATYVGGIPELVIPGVNGWLFPAGSIDELATAISECITLPIEDLESMGEKARCRVLKRHDIEHETAKLAILFRASIKTNGNATEAII